MAVRCVDCGKPTAHGPRCATCEAKNPTPHGYGHVWTKIRRAFLAAHPACAKCGVPAKQVDHVVPLSQGGTHAGANLQSLCIRCHAVKSRRERRDGLLASQR